VILDDRDDGAKHRHCCSVAWASRSDSWIGGPCLGGSLVGVVNSARLSFCLISLWFEACVCLFSTHHHHVVGSASCGCWSVLKDRAASYIIPWHNTADRMAIRCPLSCAAPEASKHAGAGGSHTAGGPTKILPCRASRSLMVDQSALMCLCWALVVDWVLAIISRKMRAYDLSYLL
jgi:hypothetical protein